MTTIPRRYTAHLMIKQRLTPTVLQLVFQTTEPLLYEPGQYASWLLGKHRRPMSFATPPAGTQAEFLVDIAPGGIASQFSQQLTVGDTMNFLAPYGQFVIDEANHQPRLFLATGTGIAPIRAQLLADHSHQAAILVFGALTAEKHFLEQEFRVLSQEHASLTFVPVCRYQTAGWSGAVGHVAEVALDTVDKPTNYTAYVCGSPEFVNEATHILTARGLSQQYIHTEQYI